MTWVEVATEPQAIARVLGEIEHDGGASRARERPPPRALAEQLALGFTSASRFGS